MKKLLAFILLAAVIAALIWAFLHFKGFGLLGDKSEDGKGKNDTSVSEVVEKTEPVTTEENKDEKLAISISKNEYVIDNKMTGIDDLIKLISEKDKNIGIEITIDDTAAKNTVDELTDKLDELGYKNYKKIDK